MTSHHLPTDPALWTGRPSEVPEYWYQKVSCLPPQLPVNPSEGKSVALLGYAGDEGVGRNRGRTGAAKGPEAIRKMLAPLAYHLPEDLQIADYGDIMTLDEAMEDSHAGISAWVYKLLDVGHFPVLLGGGHDLALAHAQGIREYLEPKNKTLGIINLDAHFDLRKPVAGKGHSGSPFFQLAEAATPKFPFHYLCLGIQKASNPPSLFATAKEMGVHWMEMDQFRLSNWGEISSQLDQFCGKVDQLYLTLDMDGFAAPYALGVSAPSPMGFTPELAFKVFDHLALSGKLISMDVVELNPRFDSDHLTAKLAARAIDALLNKLFQ
ncbi:formimidoylglutamase [Pararhodonellum marinum]|uniref:formimidoylglutamase n=1 Tax=Pararhodonellum marinum TaxID=2755358 RepID=UPI00188F9691|nr:formimidoylglutamase [Pararhodonellum marinum]